MALNPLPVADAIATAVQATAPAPGTPITPANLKTMWETVITLLYNDIKASADVNPGSFANSGGPVTGTGTIS